jgi:hypothetical protein
MQHSLERQTETQGHFEDQMISGGAISKLILRRIQECASVKTETNLVSRG